MKATGIVRRIDDLGRIVIPKEIRRTLHIRETDPMEIFTDTEGQIILKKYSPIGDISTFAGKYAESLSDATGMTVCITDREQVIAASGDDKKNLMNKPVTKELNQAMEGRCTIAASHLVYCPLYFPFDPFGFYSSYSREILLLFYADYQLYWDYPRLFDDSPPDDRTFLGWIPNRDLLDLIGY